MSKIYEFKSAFLYCGSVGGYSNLQTSALILWPFGMRKFPWYYNCELGPNFVGFCPLTWEHSFEFEALSSVDSFLTHEVLDKCWATAIVKGPVAYLVTTVSPTQESKLFGLGEFLERHTPFFFFFFFREPFFFFSLQ